MKRWLCRHGWHHWAILEVDNWCDWGNHWEATA